MASLWILPRSRVQPLLSMARGIAGRSAHPLRITPAGQRRRSDRPAIISTSSAWTLLGTLYFAAASVVLATTFLPDAPANPHIGVVRTTDVISVVTAVVLFTGQRRLPRALVNPILAASSILITVATLWSGGGVTAVAYATLYLIGPVYCRFVLPQRQATAQLLLIMALGVPALAVQPGVGSGIEVIVWGVAIIEGAAISWLVNTLQRAETDALTGLPNRQGVERLLGEALAIAPSESDVSIIVIELHKFRAIDGSFGRDASESLALENASIWASLLPSPHVLGRLSGADFVAVLRSTDLEQAAVLADSMRRAASTPLGCSAGVASGERGESAPALLARAERAAKAAQRHGQDQTVVDRGTSVDGCEVREALVQGQFQPWFQPIVDLKTQRIAGAEALARWQHPLRGVLPPSAFMEKAERAGAMCLLGEQILGQACAAAAAWPAPAGGTAPYVSVNASSAELQDPAYAATVRQALNRSGLDPRRLVIELVENEFEAESVHLLTNLQALRELGVRTALDDFGIGYSSLDRLRRLTSDVIKIDKSFIDDIVDASQPAPLVRAVLAMADALGLRVIAEGVEEQVQASWLLAQGCGAVQGWLFGKPMSADDFARRLEDERVSAHTE